jgi:hypothetical protein
MIKIYSNSPPIVYQIDNSYNLPSVTGQVRWNGMNKYFEVCDNGSAGTWHRIDNNIQLSSDSTMTQVLEWAKKKMVEDERVEKLAKEYPAVRDAKEQLDIIIKLVQNESEPSA